jgi:hypothetical protein
VIEVQIDGVTHLHSNPEGNPFDFNKAVTCPQCKTWLRESLLVEYAKECKRYGTPYDERNIAHLLTKYN